MRKLTVWIAGLSVAAACAASRQEVEVARAAHYRGEPAALLRAARQATADKYQIAASDETALRIETAGRWYTPDGLGASERGNDMRDVPDRSVHLKMVVRLLAQGADWQVEIEPVMVRYFTGRPNPDPLPLSDPSAPGWAHGRVDQLYSAIHHALQSYQVQGTSRGTTPQPAAAEPAAPPPAPTPPPSGPQ